MNDSVPDDFAVAVSTDDAPVPILPERIDCDYYRMLAGDMDAVNRFRGEYMAQYSWAELTKGELYFRNTPLSNLS